MFEVIVNPAGASGKTLKIWQKAQTVLKQSGAECRVYFSARDHRIPEIVREITSDGKNHDLIVVGGDGTMNEVVNGIQNFPKTRVGLIPCGSGNDLAKSIGLEKDIQKAVNEILNAQTIRTLDIGEVTYLNAFDENNNEIEPESRMQRFAISSGIGFDAEICHDAGVSRAKKILNRFNLGKLIYILVALKVIFTTEMVPSVVKTDQHEHTFQKLLFTVGMNEPYEGGGFKFAPNATGTSGHLDMVAADSLSRFDFFRMFPYAYTGAHVRFKGVHIEPTGTLEIETEKPLWVHADGEVKYKSSHVRLTLIKEKLQMLN